MIYFWIWFAGFCIVSCIMLAVERVENKGTRILGIVLTSLLSWIVFFAAILAVFIQNSKTNQKHKKEVQS